MNVLKPSWSHPENPIGAPIGSWNVKLAFAVG